MLEPPVKPIEWLDDRVRIIDQRDLPGKETHLDLMGAVQVGVAIRLMALRGAPLIGIAAAMGVAIESRRWVSSSWEEFKERVEGASATLRCTRPTARNLFWALDRMKTVLEAHEEDGVPRTCSEALVAEALGIFHEDLEMGAKMGEIGADLIKDGMTLLTHCNAGGLATSGFGTALAPMYVAHGRGLGFKVFADETRPLLQGARLTAWELSRAGIDVVVICDSAAHLMLSRARVDLVFVGADRVTLSGDFANKIGTYGVALSAKANGVPFYVVAPTSTIDFSLERGADIPIEERDPREVTRLGDVRLVPAGVAVENPAFDVTPAHLVTGIITEKGLAAPPFKHSIATLKA